MIFVVDEACALMDFRYNRHFKSPKWGKRDDQKGCTDGSRRSLWHEFPQELDAETSKVITNLVENGQEYIVAHGGHGNIRFALPLQHLRLQKMGNRVRTRAQLELKVLADVGLVGFPSVGNQLFSVSLLLLNQKVEPYHLQPSFQTWYQFGHRQVNPLRSRPS